MTTSAMSARSRCEQLRVQCEQQRQQLRKHFSNIETRLQTTDAFASTIGAAIKRPELWLAAVAGIWAIKRASLWSLFGRGWMLWPLASRWLGWLK